MSQGKNNWRSRARSAIGLLLLVWIVHSIFVNEARMLAKRGELFTATGQPVKWDSLSRSDQWRYGWRYGPPALGKALGSVDASAFAAAFVLMGGMLYVGALRWRIALKTQGLDLPLAQTLRLSLIAHFFNALLLGTAGGDVAKAYYAARETRHKKTEAVLTVAVDRIVGLWAMLLFGGLMLLPNWAMLQAPGLLRTLSAVLLMAMAGSSLFVFVAFRGGVSRAWRGAHDWIRRLPKGDWIERTLESCRAFGRHRWFVSQTLSLSMAINLMMVLQFYLLALGLHIHVSFLALAVVVPLVICISALPISPSGLGVRENLFVHLLTVPAIGVEATPALSLSLLAYAASLSWSLLGGLAYLTIKDPASLQALSEADSPEA